MNPNVMLRLAPALLLSALAAPAAATSPPLGLRFEPPVGFTELQRDGKPSAMAAGIPALAELANLPNIALIAVKMKPGGGVESTFQVMVKERPAIFDAPGLEVFAAEIAAEMADGELKPTVTNKQLVKIAGRSSARVVMAGAGRRMMLYAVPDGERTALLMYAASENDFPSLRPSFETSAEATVAADPRRSPAEPAAPIAPASPNPAPAPTTPASTTPKSSGATTTKPASDSSQVLGSIAFLVGLAVIVVLLIVSRRRKTENPPPDATSPSKTGKSGRKRR